LVRDGIVEKIRKEMATKFPDVHLSQLTGPADVAVAFSYSQAGVTYTHSYFNRDLAFGDPTGKSHAVRGFGLGTEDDSMYRDMRKQVQVVFANPNSSNGGVATEFVVDLCMDSSPNQIVVARIPRKGSLAETLADVDPGVQSFTATAASGASHPLHDTDTLLVPEMHWKIEHRFDEMEGPTRPFLNLGLAGNYLIEVRQIIAFDMDKRGAQVQSETRMRAASMPQAYEYSGPLLLYLKKRDAKHPFFVMWVDNGELLCKR
jgi:hypothetical protein